MIISPQVVQDLQAQFQMDFKQAFAAVPVDRWKDRAYRSDSRAYKTVHQWLAAQPEMRKWVGARVINNLIARAFVVSNEDWEYTFGVDVNDIFYDNLGAYEDRGRVAGDVAARWYEKLVTDAMINGTTTNAWDGQAFYSTNHPNNFDDSGAGVFSNNLATLPLTPDNLWSVCSQMMSIKNENGLPMEIVPTILEVPPQLGLKGAAAIAGGISLATTTATGAINQTSGVVAAAGVTNFLPTALQSIAGTLKLVINPRLSASPDIYYVHSTNLMKPFILQVAKDPADLIQVGEGVSSTLDPANPQAFFNKRLVFGTDAKGASVGTLPFLSFRVTQT